MIYVVPISGGKDSQACARIALDRHAKSDLRFVHQHTGFDHPATYAHMKYMEQRYGITIEMCKDERYFDGTSDDGVFNVIKAAGYFPNTVARNCTYTLKQAPFGRWLISEAYKAGRLTVTGDSKSSRATDVTIDPDTFTIYMGMRSDESSDRTNKYGHLDDDSETDLDKLSTKYDETFRHVKVILPLVIWKKEEVMYFLKDMYGDEVNPLYAMGAKRVGCFPCLLASREDWDLARADATGRMHIDRLLELEHDFEIKGSPTKRIGADGLPIQRKLIRIHNSRDVRHWRDSGEWRNIKDRPAEEPTSECSWCQTGSEN